MEERKQLLAALIEAPDPGGWRAGMDETDYDNLADAVLAAGFHL